MRSTILFLLLLKTFVVVGQSGVPSEVLSYGETAQILVVPFKSQFLLSELDHGFSTHSHMDVLEIRKQIPLLLTQSVIESANDSIRMFTLSSEEDVSALSFIHHHLSFGYEEIDIANQEPKKREKKKNREVRGELTGVNNGEIKKTPIFKERYMTARINSEELVDYIDEEYHADITIILTELDLMKSKKDGQEYEATLHYVMYDQKGALIEGNKIVKSFGQQEFALEKLNKNVLKSLGNEIGNRSVLYLTKKYSSVDSMDDDAEY